MDMYIAPIPYHEKKTGSTRDTGLVFVLETKIHVNSGIAMVMV